MRLKTIAAVAVAVVSFALAAPHSAIAADLDRADSGHARASHHRGDRAHYVPAPYPGGPDPYAYRYKPTGYYPYYDSNYWVPRKEMRWRTRYPKRHVEYGASWGFPLTCKVQLRRRHCGVPYKPHSRWHRR